MGNHAAGRAMGHTAELVLKTRTIQPALELLDQICEPWRGADAEFEANHADYVHYTDPSGPLGRLIAEAFGDPGRNYVAEEAALPSGDAEAEQAIVDAWCEAWYDGPYSKFRERYAFC